MHAKKNCPLVVDLDGTLLKSDSLVELSLVGLLRKPVATLRATMKLWLGRSAFKEAILEVGAVAPETMPLRSELLEFLMAEKARGRELHLISAANQDLVSAIATRTGLFTSAIGSNAEHNLKGINKLHFLKKRFPEGFSYAGDSQSDIPIWQNSQSIIAVAVSRSTRHAISRIDGVIEREFLRPSPTILDWIRALRAHHWTKNLLLFVPLFLSHRYVDLTAIVALFQGFLALALVTGGTYLLNDINDLDVDRIHQTNSSRPIASGAIGVGQAFIVGVLSVLLGLAAGALIDLKFFLTCCVYLGVTVAYSLVLKRYALVDVAALSGLFTLRVIMGTVLIGIPMSAWLLLFSAFLFFSLSLSKRHVEIVQARLRGDIGHLASGRGYMSSDEPLTLSLGVSSGVASVLVLILYVANDAYPIGAYKDPIWLWCIAPILLLWIARIWLLSHRGELHDDPVAFAIKDPASWFLGAIAAIIFVRAVI